MGERKEEEDECWERKGGIYRISLVGSGSRGKFRFWPGKIGGREPNSKHQPLRHSLRPSTPLPEGAFSDYPSHSFTSVLSELQSLGKLSENQSFRRPTVLPGIL